MGNQHNALETVDVNQKSQLLNYALLFAVGREMTGEACGASRDRQAIVARELKSCMH
jgi:hypothetical protein